MSDVTLNPEDTLAAPRRVSFDSVASQLELSINFDLEPGTVSGGYGRAGGAGGGLTLAGDMDQLHLKTNLANSFSLSGVSFEAGGKRYVSKANGDLQVDLSPFTGIGTKVGTLTPGLGEVVLDAWPAGSGSAVTDWRGVASAPINGPFTPFATYAVVFRIATAPVRPGSFSVLGTMQDGTTFNYSADANGFINAERVKGRINYTTGVVKLIGVTPAAPAGREKINVEVLGIPGVTEVFIDLIRQETLRYNAIAFTYLPLNAELLGIDAVRLPSDGRVPIFKPGELAVVGHTASTAPAMAVNGGTVNVGRDRLSRLVVKGSDNKIIETGYTEDLEAGIVRWADVTGYKQPVRVEHRVEDMGLVRDAQIDGTITFTRPVTHQYPVGSFVSSALRIGDLKARVSVVFDQATWNGTDFKDVPVGDVAPATYNTASYPIVVTNAGALTERWALKFKSSSTFDIIGEHVGNIGEGSINTETKPINGITGQPYMTIPQLGWGGGWAAGNVLRINTIGAMFPFWMLRTVQQGPEAAADYSFLTIVRGDVDNPIV
ncbi:hypothetical protein [Variovorax boronicumulans]|uniref:hypothetical protein n=1 Tax=Variovorax boronicumulans TaxID=436515 RepID=UPI001C57EABB